MKKLPIVLGALVALAAPALAADDPIDARKALMRNNAGASGLANAMINGDLDYSPVAGRAVIASLGATAATLSTFFPEGSHQGDTRALPLIWEDREGFEDMIAGFQAAVAEARAASGADGPPDLEAFTAAVQPALGFCATCHGTYRSQ